MDTQNYTLEVVDYDPFAGPKIESVSPLSQQQEEVWLSCAIGGDDASRSYNESVSLILQGDLDVDALQKSLEQLQLRHQSLRTTFKRDGRQMIIYDHLESNFDIADLSAVKEAEQQVTISGFLHADACQVYQLENGPLYRTKLFILSKNRFHFTFSAHHIICDGWSLGVLLQDISKLYNSFKGGGLFTLEAAPQMSSYVEQQLKYLETADFEQTQNFWLCQFNSGLPETELPIDYPRGSVRTYKSQRLDFDLEPSISNTLKKAGAQQGCSFVVTLLCAFEVFIQKISSQDTIIVGLPAAGQAASGEYGLTGHCVNLLPVKSSYQPDLSFAEYLKMRKTQIFDVLEHQQISFGKLLKLLRFSRDNSRVPLVPVVFNMDMNLDDGVAFEGLSHHLIYNPRAYESFEIFLNASGSAKKLSLEWSFNTQLFTADTIRRMMSSFEHLLATVGQNPEIALNQIRFSPKLSQPERYQQKNTAYPAVSLPELIDKHLQKHPLKTAVSFRQTKINNQDLLGSSNQLARLLAKKGIVKNDLVGLAVERSAEMIVALLAILKCGASYLPIDPEYPEDRINFMLEDAQAKFLIVNEARRQHYAANIRELDLEDLMRDCKSLSEENITPAIRPTDIAYTLYTSGSTGKPKGVQIEHRNLVNLLCSIKKWPGISSADKMLAVSTISFDIAGLELYLPLICGAEIVLADSATAKNGEALFTLIKEAKVTLIQATPPTFRLLLACGWDKPLPLRVFCCGEALQLDLAEKLLAVSAGLWNMYGPTETTIYSTGKQILASDKVISIGKPIDNTRIFVLDNQLNEVEKGQIGELYIAGDGVARGYLNRPDLNALRFLPSIKGDDNEKMYRTGDVVRLLPNDDIEHLGRADHQIKIRGYRVELGEIEAELVKQPAVAQAIVIAREDEPGKQYLTAYVILKPDQNQDQNHLDTTLKKHLKQALPAFMVPNHYVVLKEFPLTPNNKIDRSQLLKPTIITEDAKANEFIAPRTDIERLITSIWCEVLGLPNISVEDDFFEIGGHSLNAVEIMARIEQETGQRLPLASFFKSSTIESLSALLQLEGQSITWDSLVTIRAKGNKTPLYIVHGGGLNVLLFNTLVKNLDDDQPVYGLQAKGLDGIEEPLDKLEDIAAHYIEAILNQNPDGPYSLAGYSFGGTIAYEMAQQLQAKGKEVRTLALFDSYANQTQRFLPKYMQMYNRLEDITCRVLYSGFLLFKNPKSTWNYKMMRLNRKLKSLYWKLNPAKKNEQFGFFGYAHEIDLKNKIAAENYEIKPYNGCIDLFRAKERTFYMADPHYLGWTKYALNGIRVHEIPGDHNYIFAPPNDQIFAGILQRCLDHSAAQKC